MQARRWTSARCNGGNSCRVSGALTASLALRISHAWRSEKRGPVGRMDEHTKERTRTRTNEQTYERTNERTYVRTNERMYVRTGILPAIAHESRWTCVIWRSVSLSTFFLSLSVSLPFVASDTRGHRNLLLLRRDDTCISFTGVGGRMHPGFAPAHAEDLRQSWPDVCPQGRQRRAAIITEGRLSKESISIIVTSIVNRVRLLSVLPQRPLATWNGNLTQ